MRALIAVGMVTGLLAIGPRATAQPEPPEQGEAEPDPTLEEAIRQSELGRLYYDGGEFEHAAEAFSRAFDLHAEPVLGYNAARSYENAGEYESALQYYEATLELDIDDESLRQRCEDSVTRIENILARVEADRQREPARLSIVSDPTGASVFIDGSLVDEAPTEVPLPAGTYTVDLELPGHVPYTESVTLSPGQALALRISLPEVPPPPPEQVEEGGPTWWAVGLSGGIGVVLVGLGAAAAIGAHQRYDDAQNPEVQRDDEEFERLVGEGEDLKRASTFLYGLGIAAIGTAVLLYFVTDDSPDDNAGVEVDVTVGPDGAGAWLGWTF